MKTPVSVLVWRFMFWTTLGNALGGVFVVSIIKYGHAVHSTPDEERAAIAEEVARASDEGENV